MDVVIYHNPKCSKSRQTLKLLRERGVEPEIVEYLKTPPDTAALLRILKALGKGPRDILRAKEAREAGLDGPDLDGARLIEQMVKNPAVIERPIVTAGPRAAIGRPPEAVLDILNE
ncbi:MAG: arsenate reductase (glutaredoxin) [Rhodospirillales bacterium]